MGVQKFRRFVSSLQKRKYFNSSIGESDCNVILVDGTGLSFWLCDNLNFIDAHLTTFNVLKEKLIEFIEAFKAIGFDLHFYFDQKSTVAMDREKADTLISRKNGLIEKVIKLSESNGSDCPKRNKPTSGAWFVISTLEELKCTVVTHVGEADPHIAYEILTRDNIYGIISFDSDYMLLPRTRFIEMNSVTINCNIVNGETDYRVNFFEYSTDDIAKMFGISPSMMYLVASFLGNDFTTPVLLSNPGIYSKYFGIKNIYSNPDLVISKIKLLLSNQEKLQQTLCEIEKEYPLLYSRIEYSKNFYTNPETLFEETEVQQEWDINSNATYSAVYFENIRHDKPSINDIVEHLECAGFYLLTPKSLVITQDDNTSSLYIYRRIGNKCGSKEVLFSQYLDENFNTFKEWKNSCSLEQLFTIFQSSLSKLNAIKTPVSDNFVEMANQYNFPHAMKAIALLHIVSSCNHWNNPLSYQNFVILLIHCIVTNSNLIPDNLNKVFLSKSDCRRPSIETIGLYSLYTGIISNLHAIIRAIKYSGYIGSPISYSNGHLFVYIIENLKFDPSDITYLSCEDTCRVSITKYILKTIQDLFPNANITEELSELCMFYLKSITEPFGTVCIPLSDSITNHQPSNSINIKGESKSTFHDKRRETYGKGRNRRRRNKFNDKEKDDKRGIRGNREKNSERREWGNSDTKIKCSFKERIRIPTEDFQDTDIVDLLIKGKNVQNIEGISGATIKILDPHYGKQFILITASTEDSLNRAVSLTKEQLTRKYWKLD